LVYGGFSLGGNCPGWGESGTGAGGANRDGGRCGYLSEFGFGAIAFLFSQRSLGHLGTSDRGKLKLALGKLKLILKQLIQQRLSGLIASGVLIVNLQFRAGLFHR